MDNIANYVGNRIKFFRKLNGLSINGLATLVHKSKSTISKYENGIITIDVESLHDIANALQVDISQFLNYETEQDESTSQNTVHGLFGKKRLYLYYYDGRKKSIIKSYMTIQNNNSQNVNGCTFYMDVPDFQHCEECQFYYIGEMYSFDLVTYFTLINQVNPMERLGLCILNPFQNNTSSWGMMFGISYKPIAPFALKFLISNAPMKESELSLDDLSITQNEIKMMKSLNMMLLE